MDNNDNSSVGIGPVVLVIAIAAAIYFYKFYSPAPAPAPVPPAATTESPAPSVPAAAAPAEPLPKLEESDGFVRGKAAALSSSPVFAAWLKTDDLIPRFAAAVNMIGSGRVPKDGLSFLAPRKKFLARRTAAGLVVDPRGYARYDALGDAVASVDAAAAARLFVELRPLLQQAYQGLGERNGDVQEAVARAAAELLKAPVPPAGAALKEKGIVYGYADDALEGLNPAQKQLMRMGPANERKIQDKLRDFVRALGAPASGPAR